METLVLIIIGVVCFCLGWRIKAALGEKWSVRILFSAFVMTIGLIAWIIFC